MPWSDWSEIVQYYCNTQLSDVKSCTRPKVEWTVISTSLITYLLQLKSFTCNHCFSLSGNSCCFRHYIFITMKHLKNSCGKESWTTSWQLVMCCHLVNAYAHHHRTMNQRGMTYCKSQNFMLFHMRNVQCHVSLEAISYCIQYSIMNQIVTRL